jgi:hypothetical protein
LLHFLSLCFLIFSVRTEEREGKGGREGHAEGGGASRKKRSFVLKPGDGRFVKDAGGVFAAALLQYGTGG